MSMSSPAAGAVIALARTPAAAARYDLTPRGTVVCAVLALVSVTALDLLDGRLGLLFSVGFVLVVLSAATAVRDGGFYTVGVLPPVLLISALFVVAATTPSAIVIERLPADTGVFGTTLSATIAQGPTMLIGHGLAIAMIVARLASRPR